jgi:hypothetical protein
LATFGLAVAAVSGCQEQLDAGNACPLLCPQQSIILKDTTLDAVVFDSTLAGFPELGNETVLLLSSRGDTLDTRVIFRFDTIIQTYRRPGATVDSTIERVDSATVRVVLDTSAIDGGLPARPNVPVTLEAYDVDTTAADTVADGLLPLFRPDRLLGSKTFAPESILDTLFVPIDASKVLDKIVNGTHLRVGLKMVSGTSAQLRFFPQFSAATQLRFKPAPDTSVIVSLLSKTPTDSGQSDLQTALADYVIVAKGPPAPPAGAIAIGGFPARRTFMKFSLPSLIVDSQTVVRATLLLTQTPARMSPGLRDSVAVYPSPVTAGTAVTDVPLLTRLISATLPVDSLRSTPADSGVLRVQMVDLVRVWKSTRPEQTQRSVVLRIGAESGTPSQMFFFSHSNPDPALRPRVQITYVPR